MWRNVIIKELTKDDERILSLWSGVDCRSQPDGWGILAAPSDGEFWDLWLSALDMLQLEYTVFDEKID